VFGGDRRVEERVGDNALEPGNSMAMICEFQVRHFELESMECGPAVR